MIKEYFYKYKYYITGILLFLVVFFVYSVYAKFKNNEKKETNKIITKNEKKQKQNNNEELIIISKMFQKEMDKSIQSLITFAKSEIDRLENKKYTDFSKEAFQKDVIKKNILIDTISLDSDNKDTSNYKIRFGKGKFSEKFRNVIGLRLINCLIPNIYIRINNTNNLINYKVVDGTVDPSKETISSFKIPDGAYTFETLGDIFQIKLNQISDENGLIFGNIIITSDISTYKYSISGIPLNKTLLFLWKENNNTSYKIFGADAPPRDDIKIKSEDYIFPNPSDQSIHFIDLVVDEVPNIACKINSKGKHILDRIPLYYPTGSLSFYRTPEGDVQTKNYFYPIDLPSLTIKLYDDFGNFYENSKSDHFLEFEITILENDSLV